MPIIIAYFANHNDHGCCETQKHDGEKEGPAVSDVDFPKDAERIAVSTWSIVFKSSHNITPSDKDYLSADIIHFKPATDEGGCRNDPETTIRSFGTAPARIVIAEPGPSEI